MIDLFLAVIGVACLLIGLIGCVVPVLPGLPISYAGILCIHFTRWAEFSTDLLLILAAVAVAVTVLDLYLPAWFTKSYGGSRAASAGAMIGVVAGLFFFPPWGLVLCPFLGAFVGELVHDARDHNKAFKVALGAFAAFLAGTGLKIAASGVMLYYGIAGFFA